jgi:polysaccharide biosynthesis protein PslH
MAEFLFLAHRLPYPPDRGDKIRSWHMLKRLAELGRVHLGCFADDETEAAQISGLRAELNGALGEVYVEVRTVGKVRAGLQALRTGKPISLTLFASERMRAFAAKIAGRANTRCIFAYSGQMAQFVPLERRQPFVMDFVDMDSAKFADYAAGTDAMRWVNAREARKLLAFERETAARADVSLFVSEAEAGLFRSRSGLPDADIRVVQNGVDLRYFDPAAPFAALSEEERGSGAIILFTGQMDYRPNVEAVVAFAHGVLPAIRSREPSARFVIAGRNPSHDVQALASEAVQVTGPVADMRAWLAAADVVVAPLKIARGVQNKVLEAMAMARPVVASSAAFEGIEAVPGRDLIVTDDPAEAILALLADPVQCSDLGTVARAQVGARYQWSARLKPLADIVGVPSTRAAA